MSLRRCLGLELDTTNNHAGASDLVDASLYFQVYDIVRPTMVLLLSKRPKYPCERAF